MGLLDKWHLRRAKEINEEAVAKMEADRKEREDYWKLTCDMRNAVRSAIMVAVDEHVAKMEADRTVHLKEGELAVLNIYRLGRDGYNGWDSGPSALTMNVKTKMRPITVRIKKLYVARDFALEVIDKFMEYDHLTKLYELAQRDTIQLQRLFVQYLQRGGTSKRKWDDDMGLYWCASFELGPEFEFSPKWGLNADSFLMLDSPEGKETLDVWMQEIGITEQLIELDARKKEIECRKKAIEEKYRGIKYTS